MKAPATGATYKFLTWQTPDGNSGNVSATAWFWFDNSFGFGTPPRFGVCFRGSASTLNNTSTDFYAAEVSANDYSIGAWSITLYKVSSGTWTTIGGLSGMTSNVSAGWFGLTPSGNGSTISASLVRGSDGYYLNSSGSWVSGARNCLSVTDSAYSGSGYSGIYSKVGANVLYTDDFALDALGGTSVTVPVDFLGAAGAFAPGASVACDNVISAASFGLAALLPDTGRTVDPLVASGKLATVGILNPPNLTIGALPLIGSGILPSIAVTLGAGVPVAPLVASGVLGAVSPSTGISSTVAASPLVASGSLGSATAWTDWTSSSVLVYRVYSNDGAGGPIDYDTPIATTQALSWTSAGLTYPGDWSFGVRVYSLLTGLEELNVDAITRVILDASGNDITNRPIGPVLLRAFPTANGGGRAEWAYPFTDPARRPTGFRVYTGPPGSVDYGTPSATVPWKGNAPYSVDLPATADGSDVAVCVRAFNASAEDPNTLEVDYTADAVGPAPVQSLAAIAV